MSAESIDYEKLIKKLETLKAIEVNYQPEDKKYDALDGSCADELFLHEIQNLMCQGWYAQAFLNFKFYLSYLKDRKRTLSYEIKERNYQILSKQLLYRSLQKRQHILFGADDENLEELVWCANWQVGITQCLSDIENLKDEAEKVSKRIGALQSTDLKKEIDQWRQQKMSNNYHLWHFLSSNPRSLSPFEKTTISNQLGTYLWFFERSCPNLSD